MARESCADRVLRLHAEYVAWKSVRKWSAGPAETRDVSEFCAKRMDAIRTEAIAAVRLQMAEIENMRRTRGMEHWAIQGDVSDALDTLSKYAWTKARMEEPEEPTRPLRDWSSVHVNDLGISRRAANALERAGVITVRQLIDFDPQKLVSKLIRLPQVGRRTIDEIERARQGVAK